MIDYSRLLTKRLPDDWQRLKCELNSQRSNVRLERHFRNRRSPAEIASQACGSGTAFGISAVPAKNSARAQEPNFRTKITGGNSRFWVCRKSTKFYDQKAIFEPVHSMDTVLTLRLQNDFTRTDETFIFKRIFCSLEVLSRSSLPSKLPRNSVWLFANSPAPEKHTRPHIRSS